jgi:hypothetical protein
MEHTMSNEIEAIPVSAEELSPAEYLEAYRANPGRFASARIRPPRLGEPGFGGIVVQYQTPLFRTRFGPLSRRP